MGVTDKSIIDKKTAKAGTWEHASKNDHFYVNLKDGKNPSGYLMPCCGNRSREKDDKPIEKVQNPNYISKTEPLEEGKIGILNNKLLSIFKQDISLDIKLKDVHGFYRIGVKQLGVNYDE